jgi:hypothetical protein
MVVLMGMAALAIDAAAGWNERRQDQTASDLSAVAGGLSFGNNDTIAAQAKATARANVDSTYTDTEWAALWSSCTDSDRPPGFTPLVTSSGIEQCISINPSFLRVRLPDQTVGTSFGGILGIDSLTTHADAIVTLFPLGGAGALPFAVQADATSGELCLDTSTGGKIVPPCDGNEQGSYGNIAPPLFGEPTTLNTSPACSNQTASGGYIAESIAMGIDHLILSLPASTWNAQGPPAADNGDNSAKEGPVDAYSNMDRCIDTGGQIAEAADGAPINAVLVDSGNAVKAAITEGLMTGGVFADGLGPRLTRTGPYRTVAGYQLDNTPLWDHLLAGSTPASCDGSTFAGLPDIAAKNTQMTTCLTMWTSGDGQIFDDSILTSSRLGVAPRTWHEVYGNGLAASPVMSFEVVYIHALHFDDKDNLPFYPGDGTSPITLQNWKDIEQVTAYLLDPLMVSSNVTAIYPGLSGEFDPALFE